jgi:hypothetical protein
MSVKAEMAAYAEKGRITERLVREREDAKRKADIAELRRLVKAENHRQDALKIIRDMAAMVEPPKMRAVAKPPKGAPLHVKGLVTSDWQMGQLSKLGASGGMYEQTSAITNRQLRQMWATLEWRHRIMAHGKRFEEFVLFDLGDLLEGDQMRVSQASEIDALVTKQALDVLDMEAWLIKQSLQLFPKVRVLKVGGNHDRTSSKPGNAGLGELGFTDTYSWLIGEFLKRMFERSIDQGRLEIVNHESFFGTAYVAGLRCVYEHGASFKTSTGSYGGVPFYPIANAARGYKEMLDGADIVLMGHHHKGMVLPMNGGWGWQIVNGALPPSSSWIQAGFKGYGRPVQVELEFHENKGLTDWAPIYLEQPEHGRPGQYWAKQKGV